MRHTSRITATAFLGAATAVVVLVSCTATDPETAVLGTTVVTRSESDVAPASAQEEVYSNGFLRLPAGAQRLAGPDRFATAAAVAVASFPDGATSVLLARGGEYADALAASALAGVAEAPILLTADDELSDPARAAIDALAATDVVILGGIAAISPAVEAELVAVDLRVSRIEGPDRYATGAAIARRVASGQGVGQLDDLSSAFLASGNDYPDALAAGAIAYVSGAPILLSPPDALSDATAEAIQDLEVEQVFMLGGVNALSDDVSNQLEQLGVSVRRIGGANRLETATLLAEFGAQQTTLDPRSIVLVRGDAFPDALAASPFAGETRSLILLTQTADVLGEETAGWLLENCDSDRDTRTIVAVGSVAAVADVVLGEAVDRSSCEPTAAGPEPEGASEELLSADQQRFTDSINGWVPQGNASIGSVSGVGRDSAPAMSLTVDPNGPFPDDSRRARVGTTPGVGGVPVVAETTYDGELWIRSDAGSTTALCELRWYDETGEIIDTIPGDPVGIESGQWAQTECQDEAPASTAYASLRVVVEDVEYGSIFYVDDASLVGQSGVAGPAASDPPAPAPTPTPTQPTTEPTPTGTPSTTPTPAGPAAYPDGPGDTGISAAGLSESDLSPSGSLTVGSGEIIEGLMVDGSITIEEGATDVTIRNTLVVGNGIYGIRSSSGVQDLLIENVTIRGVSGSDRSAGILARGSGTIRGVDVSGFPDGIKVFSNFVVEDSWIHDQVLIDDSHNDGIQSVGGTNVIIRNNRIEGRYQAQTSALILQADNSPLSNYTISGNYLSGGNYTLYIRAKDDQPDPTDMVVTNNVWNGVSDEQSTEEPANSYRFGPCSFERGAGWTLSGNTFIDGTPNAC